MRAGKLDRTIRLDRVVHETNDFGTPVETWATLATLRAEIVSASTEEFIRDFGASDETVTVFRCRYLAGVTLADRVFYEGRPYDLKEIVEIGRRKGLELRCRRAA